MFAGLGIGTNVPKATLAEQESNCGIAVSVVIRPPCNHVW